MSSGVCPDCGAKNAMGAANCRSCRQVLLPSEPPVSDWRRIVPAALVGLVVAMAVMGALNVLSNDALSVEAWGPVGLAVGAGVAYLLARPRGPHAG